MRRLTLLLFLVLAAPAAASGPALTVPKAKLKAALKCPIPPSAYSDAKPVMFVTGTGATGDQGYLIGQDAFMPLLGVAALVAFVGIGLLTASKFLERANAKDENPDNRPLLR